MCVCVCARVHAGIAVSWTKKAMLTVDFIEPASTLSSSAVTRTTVRLWDMSDMSISETIDASALGVNGPMDAVPIAETGERASAARGTALAPRVQACVRAQHGWKGACIWSTV